MHYFAAVAGWSGTADLWSKAVGLSRVEMRHWKDQHYATGMEKHSLPVQHYFRPLPLPGVRRVAYFLIRGVHIAGQE